MPFLVAASFALAADQWVKSLFLEGYTLKSECISLILTFNRGVAFSMLSFLGPSLKWLQLLLLGGVVVYLIAGGHLRRYAAPAGLLVGAGFSNIYDRFLHGGVVDYVAWHCGFDFAIFNLADVVIDLAVLWILVLGFKKK